MSPLLLSLVVLLALVMAYYNGFHDASNAVSTAITTRSLRESTALGMAAILNLLGALLGMAMIGLSLPWALHLLGLEPLAAQLVDAPDVLALCLLAIITATLAWEVLTWWMGMPSSTWHSFFGGVLGVSLIAGSSAPWGRFATILAISVVGPLLAIGISFAVMQALLALIRTQRVRIDHVRFAQTVTAGLVATGHGIADSRIPLAVVAIAVIPLGLPTGASLALMLPIALAMAAGTFMGGHRIIRTIGRRLTDLSASQGLAAESTSAGLMGLGAIGLEFPMSSSHSLASSVIGAGVAMGPRQVRWNVARTMVGIWVVTPIATAVIAGSIAAVLRELPLV